MRAWIDFAQVLADGVAREASATGDLPDGLLLSQGPAPADTQCCHVYHSWSPAAQKSSRLGLVRGSGLDGNQQSLPAALGRKCEAEMNPDRGRSI